MGLSRAIPVESGVPIELNVRMGRLRSLVLLLYLGVVLTACSPRSRVVESYAHLAYQSYGAAYFDAKKLLKATSVFTNRPTAATFDAVKGAWLAARMSYGRTEVFRFYGGPIDAPLGEGREEGPEGRLNAWPVNEAYLDYVEGDPDAGILQDPDVRLDGETVIALNAATDEANVTTGYHAIEFLLWGQDLFEDGPGRRSVEDFQHGRIHSNRRCQYLEVVTQILVSDLAGLVNAWDPGRAGSYYHAFVEDTDVALGRILTGLATFAGFEMASERIAVPLRTGDQEDEHSCFSDNTHNDYRAGLEGLRNVYLASYRGWQGFSLRQLIEKTNMGLAARIENQLSLLRGRLDELEVPVDRVLASPAGPGGAKLGDLAAEFQTLAGMFLEAGAFLQVEVEISGE
jgi:putative iron-regulated protein